MASVSDSPPFPRAWRSILGDWGGGSREGIRVVNVGRIPIRNAELPRRPIARDRPKNGLEMVAMQSLELSRAGWGVKGRSHAGAQGSHKLVLTHPDPSHRRNASIQAGPTPRAMAPVDVDKRSLGRLKVQLLKWPGGATGRSRPGSSGPSLNPLQPPGRAPRVHAPH